MRFQVFTFASKKVQGFSSDRKILISLLSVFLSQFSEILIFNQDVWGNVHYVPAINLISYRTLIKVLYFPSKTNQNKSETWFCGQKTTEDNKAKINVSPDTSSKLVLLIKFYDKF